MWALGGSVDRAFTGLAQCCPALKLAALYCVVMLFYRWHGMDCMHLRPCKMYVCGCPVRSRALVYTVVAMLTEASGAVNKVFTDYIRDWLVGASQVCN